MLHLKCKGQEMKVDVDERIADKYINANKVHFEFCERWAGMIITAQFTQKQDGVDKTYDVVVDELTNMVTMPNEIVAGEVHISAFGVDPVTGVRITSIPVKKTIDKSGFVGDGETPVPPTPDLYAQLLEQFGNGVPPSTGAYKQLVTDKSGAIAWDNLRVMAGTNRGSVRTSAAAAEQTLGYKLGNAAFAANMETEASGQAAFAAGFGTEAIGKNSFAEGQHTIANGENQHVQGKFNVKDTANKYAHIVGNGTTNAKRSNAHTLDWDGNAWFKGGVYVGGDDQSKGEKLVTKSELDAAVAAGGGGSGSGGGLPTGGDPNMMLVTDADGNTKWEARTHYSENAEVAIYSEVTAIYGDDVHMIVEPYLTYPTVGNTYTVSFGETQFDCVATEFEIDGIPLVVLGNLSPLGVGEDTGEPFVMMMYPENVASSMGAYVALMMFTGETTDIIVSVSGMAEVVHKIDEKYIPSVGASSLINGSAIGSVRQIFGTAEDAEYTMGHCAVAFGTKSKAIGDNSFASGESTAKGWETFAVNESEAAGDNSFSANLGTTVEGASSAFAANEGRAEGPSSFAVNAGTAKGRYAFAAGRGCIANYEQHVVGKYNVEDSTSLYIVGNGSYSKRSNAHTLSEQGDAWYAGTVEGTALILKSSTSGSTKRFKITVDDSGAIKATAL